MLVHRSVCLFGLRIVCSRCQMSQSRGVAQNGEEIGDRLWIFIGQNEVEHTVEHYPTVQEGFGTLQPLYGVHGEHPGELRVPVCED